MNHDCNCLGAGQTCRDCHCGKCKPACYAHNMWDIQIDPVDPTKWLIIADGVMHKVNAPAASETPTSLTFDKSAGNLIYKGETQTYIIPGEDLGNILELNDLRDVNFDPAFTGTCSELIYRKFQDCGDGCQSPADQWTGFNINSEGAKTNGIRYVRGTNIYGCPTYLDIPTDTSKFWWGMWRPVDGGYGTEFGYTQPDVVTSLPTDSDGNTLVMSQNSQGKPIIGPINNQFREWLDFSYCTEWVPADGYVIAYDEHGPGGNSFCYFPNRGVAKCSLDLFVSSAMSARTLFDEHVATLKDPQFYPALAGGYYDFPVNPIWANNSDGKIIPMMYRIDKNGRLLVSGEMTARSITGKTRFIVGGLDSTIDYSAVGPFGDS